MKRGHRAKTRRSPSGSPSAAFFEFLSAPAWTGLVSADLMTHVWLPNTLITRIAQELNARCGFPQKSYCFSEASFPVIFRIILPQIFRDKLHHHFPVSAQWGKAAVTFANEH